MYDEIKNFVSTLAFIISILGLLGYINSRNNKPSGNSRVTSDMNPKDLGKTGYGRPEDVGAVGYRQENIETTGYEQPEIAESASTAHNTYPEIKSSQNIRPNILKQLGYSFIPHRYEKLAAVKTGSMIGFVTLLSLTSTLCILAAFIITFIARGGADTFLDWVPEFELRNGILSLEDDYYVKDTGYIYIYLTDQIDGFRPDDINHIIEQGYGKAILGGSEKIVLIQNGTYVEHYYTAYGDDLELNRKIIVEKLMPILWVIYGIMFLIFFVGRTFWYFGCASLYFLAALLITSLLRRKIPAGTLFRVAIYAKVPMLVVTTFWTSPYLSGIFRIAVTAGFIAFAIGHLLNSQDLQKRTQINPPA